MADEVSKEKKSKDKKPKQPSKVGRRIRDFFSELKKVTWPSFSKVLKQTGVVLMVTVCFLLVLIAFDSLFGLMYNYLIGGLSEQVTASVFAVDGGLFGGGLL